MSCEDADLRPGAARRPPSAGRRTPSWLPWVGQRRRPARHRARYGDVADGSARPAPDDVPPRGARARRRRRAQPRQGQAQPASARRAPGRPIGARRRARHRGRLCTAGRTQQPSEALGEVAGDAVEADPLLLHRVALADRDRVVLEGVEVDGHAVRRADLVLAAVAAADRAGVVEVDVPAARAARSARSLRLGRQVGVALQRQHRDLDRREPRVEPQHGALVDAALGVGRLVLGVGVDQEGHQAARAGRPPAR